MKLSQRRLEASTNWYLAAFDAIMAKGDYSKLPLEIFYASMYERGMSMDEADQVLAYGESKGIF